MTMIIDGTNGLTFNDATTQAAAGLVVGSASPVTRGTSVASTSGTSIDFTSIPSWVKRITVILNGVSLSGSAHLLVQIGVGSSPTTSGYLSGTTYALIASSGTLGTTSTAGYCMWIGSTSYTPSGHMVISNISGNNWICSGLVANTNSVGYTGQAAGTGSLSGTLGMVRITSTNGTDTFDAGSINILYE
jgi:hypothetical protein